jgi:hypothetical protein
MDYCPLSIVLNTDGFLMQKEMRQELSKCGVDVFAGSRLEIRIYHELTPLQEGERRCYVIRDAHGILPDIRRQGVSLKCEIATFFSNYGDKAVLAKLPYLTLARLYEQHIQGHVSKEQLQMLLSMEKQCEVVSAVASDYGPVANRLKQVELNWNDVLTIKRLSQLFVEAVEHREYATIAADMDRINHDFQSYLDRTYRECINANPFLNPKCVNRVLLHIQTNLSKGARVALIVVDGMAYWQYELLRQDLECVHIKPQRERWMYSWIPSITCLSRQAIFRGDVPSYDYKQSPQQEEKLWTAAWKRHKGRSVYLYDTPLTDADCSADYVAYVTVSLDEKMHCSSDYEDLLELTRLWAKRFVDVVRRFKEAGFTIYLTTDHGGVCATGFRPFSAAERVHLYEHGSRGRRHAIFKDEVPCSAFAAAMAGKVRVLQRDLSFACRNNECFTAAGHREITHGGTHFFEVMIPFVKF